MRRLIRIEFLVIVALLTSGCSTASYQVMQKGTWKIGVPAASQPVQPNILHTVSADAPGGQAAIIVVYFGGDQPPVIEAKGDSSALVNATAAVGRKAMDLAVQATKASAGLP